MVYYEKSCDLQENEGIRFMERFEENPSEWDKLEEIARCVNVLSEYLGQRDVPLLSPERLMETYGVRQVDVMVLFGGSVLAGGDVLAEAMRKQVAQKYIIVGGEGHTTSSLREEMHRLYPDGKFARMSEAEIFSFYLARRYGLQPDEMECKSTNCGNNITNLLELLRKKGFPFDTVILCQDAAMQRRMDAGFRKYAPVGARAINFAAYSARVRVWKGKLAYVQEIHGMWDIDRYMELLMGEIPRLRDDAGGYGPRGRGYVAHVEIPGKVMEAFEELEKEFGAKIRIADARYASAKA